jgi:hypothetical protein
MLLLKKRLLAIIIATSLLHATPSRSQNLDAKKTYFSNVGDQLGLYNGTKYEEAPTYYKESNPYFMDNKVVNGSIQYFHVNYENVNFRYDVYADILIFEDPNHIVQLINDEIQGFTIDKMQFVPLGDKYGIQKGFYQVLHDGKTKAFKKYIKYKKEKIVFSELVGTFDPYYEHYILFKNTMYPIEGKKQILKLFADKKSAIRQFIRKNKLRYGKNPDEFISKITAFYDL